MRAYSELGVSDYSKPVSITLIDVPGPVTMLSVSSDGTDDDFMKVMWQEPNRDKEQHTFSKITEYRVISLNVYFE